LEQLLGFLEESVEEEILNPVLAGYCTKLLQILFENYPRQMVEYMYSHPQHLHKMAQHIQTQGVSDLL